MRLSTKTKLALRIAETRLRAIRRPLLVGWSIESRCVFKCRFCSVWRNRTPNLPTEACQSLIDGLAQNRTFRITFTGGEPLLRDDLGHLLRYCHDRGISTTLNTSGWKVPDRIRELSTLDGLTVSIEGPPDVNDDIRGEGAYRTARSALEAARRSGLKTRITTVLTSQNLDQFEHVLEVARDTGSRVMFQPATELLLRGKEANPLAPVDRRYRETMTRLVKMKRAGDPHIANSVSGLRHLASYPDPVPIPCRLYRIYCRIDPAGNLSSCPRIPAPPTETNADALGFESAFRAVLDPRSCNDCWAAARVELNLLLGLRPEVVLNTLRHF